MTTPGRSAVLEGVVRDRDGTPVADAVVMIDAGPTHPDIAAVTDAGGHYRLGGLTPGRYTAVVHIEGRKVASLDVDAAAGAPTFADVSLP